ncbi:MAG: hypothetical protein Q8P30_03805, partial [Candidatus Uhrbacteria bacterium]|nr:hypothetical protein [Candidatus Uhrbacteria bacterium]
MSSKGLLAVVLAVVVMFVLICGCAGFGSGVFYFVGDDDDVVSHGDGNEFVPCVGKAAHFPLGRQTLDVWLRGDDETLRRYYVSPVRANDDGFCEVAGGENDGKLIPMSCLVPKPGIQLATDECPARRECLFEEDGSDCSGEAPKKSEGKAAAESDDKDSNDADKSGDEPKAEPAKSDDKAIPADDLTLKAAFKMASDA